MLLMISGTVSPDIISAVVGVIDMVVRATSRFPRWGGGPPPGFWGRRKEGAGGPGVEAREGHP